MMTMIWWLKDPIFEIFVSFPISIEPAVSLDLPRQCIIESRIPHTFITMWGWADSFGYSIFNFQYCFSKIFWIGFAACSPHFCVSILAHGAMPHLNPTRNFFVLFFFFIFFVKKKTKKTKQKLTSIKVSRSLSKLARSSFRFLLSAIKLCFFFNRPWRACSRASRSESSWLMRANMTVFSSAEARSGRWARKSWTGIRGSCWYRWLFF